MHFKVEINTLYSNRILPKKKSLAWKLSVLQKHLSAPPSQHDRKDLERVRLLEQKSGWIQNEFVHDGSVKHPYTSFYPLQQLTQTAQTGRQVDGTRRGRMVLEGVGGQY